jgi:hypothetical protein
LGGVIDPDGTIAGQQEERMVNGDPFPWLLEEDPGNPSIRYFTLRDLLGMPEDAPKVRRAKKAIMASGPAPKILAAQRPEGNWIPLVGKYQSTPAQIILLAELGADPRDRRVRLGCEYFLGRAVATNHALIYFSPPAPPANAMHCDNALLVYALIRLGFGDDPRVRSAMGWQTRALLGKLPADQYYRSGTAGPGFVCGINKGQPCGWGATKAMRALAAVPKNIRTPMMRQAIKAGADFLLSHDLAAADFPFTGRISFHWFKFGFPLNYWSDILETAEVLVDLGYGRDPRLAKVFQLIAGKQDGQGRWKLENSLNGKMWVDIENKKQPSKWITLRALRVLKRAGLDHRTICA